MECFFAGKEAFLQAQGQVGQEAIKQLEHEIALLSDIQHPNIVQYLGTGMMRNSIFFSGASKQGLSG
uniref:Protein kinase domain-containing protein n=1 Tax=Physcomitrium patens TaxID=3218 RepID=A0A7I3YY14_PHYPA